MSVGKEILSFQWLRKTNLKFTDKQEKVITDSDLRKCAYSQFDDITIALLWLQTETTEHAVLNH